MYWIRIIGFGLLDSDALVAMKWVCPTVGPLVGRSVGWSVSGWFGGWVGGSFRNHVCPANAENTPLLIQYPLLVFTTISTFRSLLKTGSTKPETIFLLTLCCAGID